MAQARADRYDVNPGINQLRGVRMRSRRRAVFGVSIMSSGSFAWGADVEAASRDDAIRAAMELLGAGGGRFGGRRKRFTGPYEVRVATE